MRVGTLCFATDQGLGYLAKSFFDNGVITDPIVVSYTARGKRPMHLEWYPNASVLPTLELCPILDDWIDNIDVFLAFETPFIWELFDICKARGVKTVLMPMHECLHQNKVKQHKPDLFLCPSLLDEKCVLRNVPGPLQTLFLPVPVQVPWRQRTRAEVFVHNAGHGGLRGRNGTAELLQAMRMVKSPAKLLLRSQVHQDWPPYPELLGKVTLVQGTQSYDQLWNEGDVLIFPERHNGLSLPLQEARAAGMLVMCGDRFPMNTWLPRAPLFAIDHYVKDRTFPQFMEFDSARITPEEIATKIDLWYNQDISEYSLQGKAWAESMSWDVLGPQYVRALEELCNAASS